jgi:hypothetical protein
MIDLDEINITKLATESAETPLIYSRYLNQYNEIVAKLRWVQIEYDIAYKERFRYYLGKAEPEVYILEPLDEKILRADKDVYLNADEILITLKRKKINLEIQEKTLERALKEISTRSFHIKNIIEWEKFQQGS